MKRIVSVFPMVMLLIVFAFGGYATIASAQMQEKRGSAPEAKDQKATEANAEAKEEKSITDHSVRIDGQTIPYKATAGTIILKDQKGEPTGSMFYVAYTRSDEKDLSQRPVSFF